MTSNGFGGRKAISQIVYSVHVQIYVYLLVRVPMDSVSLTKILCHRNFGNEFVFTHSKDYLYYLARLPLSQIYLTMKLRHRIEFT